ncbi:Oxidoreductase OXR1 like protein [Verticillium longisporum]|uniref:Oxidoreductase OXR1 like protein n=1 Tax=Verticillium longisporum TaxID=100787 RepID=A0A8I3AGD2_VERLO|nr:Oxidoreductase OXR1 like protein [Verticillium longisporum]
MGSLQNAVPPFRLLVAGGSYAGLSFVVNLLDICNGRSPRMAHDPYPHHPDFTRIPVDITIVDERDGYFHLIGSPLALASSDYAAKTWIKFQDIPALQRPNIRFVQGSLLVKPDADVTLVHSREKLLSSENLSDECKDVALDLTREAGVEVLLNHRVAEARKLDVPEGSRVRYEVEFTSGEKRFASEVIMAVSRPVPSTGYLPAETLDEEGYAKVDSSLFLEGVSNSDFHLVAGDACKWEGIKRAGGAMHMGHMAAINAHQRMIAILAKEKGQEHEPEFKALEAFPPAIGLAVGKKAVAYGPDMGTIHGEEVMEAYFRDDLGFTICYNWMGLGKSPAEEEDAAVVAAETAAKTAVDITEEATKVEEIAA